MRFLAGFGIARQTIRHGLVGSLGLIPLESNSAGIVQLTHEHTRAHASPPDQ